MVLRRYKVRRMEITPQVFLKGYLPDLHIGADALYAAAASLYLA